MRKGTSAGNASTFKQSDSLRTKHHISRLIIREEYDSIALYCNTSTGSRRELLTMLAELGLPYKHLPKLDFGETMHWFLRFLTSSTLFYSRKIPWYEFNPKTFNPECQLISLEDPFYSRPQHPSLKATLKIIADKLGSEFSTCCLLPTNPTALFVINYLAPDSNTPLSSVVIDAHAKEEGQIDPKTFLQKITATNNAEDLRYVVIGILIDLFSDASSERLDYYARALSTISSFSLIFDQSITRLFIITNALLKGANASSLSLDGSMQNMVRTFIDFCNATKCQVRMLYINLFLAPVMAGFKFDLICQEQQSMLTWIQASRAHSIGSEDMALKAFAVIVGYDSETLNDCHFRADASHHDLCCVRNEIYSQIQHTADTTLGNPP